MLTDMDLPWWQTALIYQIYPRSFQDDNGDGIGDLPGIRRRLDYLQSLGVGAIWLSPFYPSPMADFGYDIADYCSVDPCFGTLEDFDALRADCHRRGLRLIIDLVPNHSSDQHPWFRESRSSRDNPKRDWYFWRDPGPDGGPPNNWRSRFGGPAWSYDPATGQYYLHQFAAEQPELNWEHPDLVAAFQQIMRFWLDRGVDGFRVDVIWLLAKDPALRDEPPDPGYRPGIDKDHRQLWHCHTEDLPRVHDHIRGLRRIIEEYQDRVLIGEIYLPIRKLIPYYGNDDECHLPFNFQLIRRPFDAREIGELIREYEAALRPGQWPNWVIGNHDQPRIAGRAGRDRVKLAMLLLLTLRGTPTWYQGDELGLEDVPVPPEKIQDPLALRQREAGNRHGRDPVRSPMPWDGSAHAGFCPASAEPWLPLDPRWPFCHVEAQTADPNSPLSFFRRLARLRQSEMTLQSGSLTLEEQLAADVLAWRRDLPEHDSFLILANFAREEKFLPGDWPGGDWQLELSTHDRTPTLPLGPTLCLAAGEGLILRWQRDKLIIRLSGT